MTPCGMSGRARRAFLVPDAVVVARDHAEPVGARTKIGRTPDAAALQQVSAWLGQAGEEGRATVNALRSSTTESNDLAEAFRRAVEDCRRQGAIDAALTVTGDVREMHPVVRDEVYRIGYEAIATRTCTREAVVSTSP